MFGRGHLWRRIMVPALAGAMLLAGAGSATANGIPHPDLRLNLFSPPASMPAETAFYVAGGHGFAVDGKESLLVLLDKGTTFELVVDGEPVDVRPDVEIGGGFQADVVAITWYAHFADGLEAGSHQFVGSWYEEGDLILVLEVDVAFE